VYGEPLLTVSVQLVAARHFWPRELSANQQRYEQRSSKQAASDHSEKTMLDLYVISCSCMTNSN